MAHQLPHQSSLAEAPEPGGGVLTGGHQELLVRLQAGHPPGVAGQTGGLHQVGPAQVEQDGDLTGLTPEVEPLHPAPTRHLEAVYQAGSGHGGQLGLNISSLVHDWRELTNLVPH